MLYRFKVNTILSLIARDNLNIDLRNDREVHLQKVKNAIAFVNLDAKWRYNHYHILLDLEVGDMVYLQLHYGYNILEMRNRKLSN